MNVFWAILYFAVVYAATVCLVPLLIRMIRPRQTALNYQNRDIPVGLGLVFSLTVIPAVTAMLLFGHIPRLEGSTAIITVLGFAFLGLIDDTSAAARPKGF